MAVSLDYWEFREDELPPGLREWPCVVKLSSGWRCGLGGLIKHAFSSFCVPQ